MEPMWEFRAEVTLFTEALVSNATLKDGDWHGRGRAARHHKSLQLLSISYFPDPLLSALHETHVLVALIINKAIIIFTCELKKRRHKFVKWLIPGLTASSSRNCYLNSGLLAPESLSLVTMLFCLSLTLCFGGGGWGSRREVKEGWNHGSLWKGVWGTQFICYVSIKWFSLYRK